MAILGVWAEDQDFPAATRSAAFSSAGVGRTGYGRAAISLTNSSSDAIGAPIASPVTSVWLSAQVSFNGLGTTGFRFLGAGRSGYNGGIWIRTGTTTPAKVALVKVDESGTQTDLASESGASLVTGSWRKFDILIESFGATGRVRVYFAGGTDPIIDYSGDLTWATGPTNLDVPRLRFAYASAYAHFSEIIMAESTMDTRTMSVVTLYPNGAGAGNTFDSGTYAEIDDGILANDADILASGTSGQHAELALSNLPAGTFDVLAVKVCTRAVRGATGPAQLKIGIRDNTSGINVDAGRSLATAWGEYTRFMLTNPAASRDWLQADIDPLQIAVESLT